MTLELEPLLAESRRREASRDVLLSAVVGPIV
jgi:hypothetical protein